MKMRRIEITVESESVILAGGGGMARKWCAACGANVPVLSGSDAAALVGERGVKKANQEAEIHAIEGGPQVCLPSLLRLVLRAHGAVETPPDKIQTVERECSDES